MRKAAATNNTSSKGFMLMIAIAMANGSASVAGMQKKRPLHDTADSNSPCSPEKTYPR